MPYRSNREQEMSWLLLDHNRPNDLFGGVMQSFEETANVPQGSVFQKKRTQAIREQLDYRFWYTEKWSTD